jgi:hypothetical protein
MVASLQNSTIGISISDSPDLAKLGLGARQLEDAMTRIARHCLAEGARLVYGGDLREGGFTDLLFEFAAMYKRPDATRPAVMNVLAWPVHISMDRQALSSTLKALEPWGTVLFLGPSGRPMPKKRALLEAQRNPDREEWAGGLTRMRKWLAATCDARILLGGRVAEYQGQMPGVAEEALLSIRAGKPTYLAGGFGGCTRDIINAMNIDAPMLTSRSANWKGCEQFQSFRERELHDRLKLDERNRLATTTHVDEIVVLLLKGLARGVRRRRKEKRT